MKKPIQALVRCMALAVFGLGAAALAQPAGSAGAVAFVTDGRTYLGRYSLPDEAVSVEIEGLMYRGHYAARAEDAGALAPGTANTGAWGRAFLFASSAKVLQCQLATGFPQVSGQCQAADGRRFELKARP
ncbi:hypothetical protein [Polaromonas naphthalenivorans]|uniref:Uncharacterized protein n=1 Tax=Polaromonas naphthalenivorans (strain CJ2) TaxID=365044 RepID=A1VTJ0_POLNA|nr:hypothetical protein [Polaromonas naphthalenivorans]ABM38968.1 hypothetical protein Pnap_3672 [Polaromonas naphthalenivorans CJ2]